MVNMMLKNGQCIMLARLWNHDLVYFFLISFLISNNELPYLNDVSSTLYQQYSYWWDRDLLKQQKKFQLQAKNMESWIVLQIEQLAEKL